MDLNAALNNFRNAPIGRGMQEANTPVPAPNAKNPDGAQPKSKSDFEPGAPKGQQNYQRKGVTIPGDKEAMAAAKASTAGVSGPGYDASGREKVDVRSESKAPWEDRPSDQFAGSPRRDREDVAFAGAMLADAVGLHKSLREANIPAPGPDNKGPDGKAQTASKSNYNANNPQGQQDNRRKPVSVPADPAAKAAMDYSAAQSGEGYDASGREQVDARTE